MKKAHIILLAFLSLWLPAHSDELSDCPKSIAEAIEMLDKKLPEEEKMKLREMKEEGLASLHMSLGLGLRNGFCLWNRTGLTDEMERTYLVGDADEMSTLLIGIYWSHLTDPKFDLKVHLKKRREDAIKTLKQDLIDTRKKLKAIDEEREELQAIEKDIIELLKNESEPAGSGQPM